MGNQSALLLAFKKPYRYIGHMKVIRQCKFCSSTIEFDKVDLDTEKGHLFREKDEGGLKIAFFCPFCENHNEFVTPILSDKGD